MTQSFNYYKHSFIASFIALISSSVGLAQSQTDTGIRTSQPLTILSANDGATHGRLNADGRPDTEHLTLDSITAIYLGPGSPPLARTVYGTVPNSIISVPYLPMTPDGHYGFVSSAGIGPKGEPANLLSVINLASPDLDVVQKVEVPDPRTGVMHPDGKHLIIPDAKGFRAPPRSRYLIHSGSS